MRQAVTPWWSRSPRSPAARPPNVARHARDLTDASDAELREIVESFDREEALSDAERAIREGL